MTSPYDNLPDTAYWRTAVGQRSPLDPGLLYTAKFPIRKKTAIVTAGSCFAQHIGRHLRQAGCHVLDAEPSPAKLPDDLLNRFGYGLYSARYGNIYTARQLLQLWEEATGKFTPAEPVWQKNGRFYDAFRPSVEPDGLPTVELVRLHRAEHLAAVKRAFTAANVFVFTFGLTEAWIHKASGTVYPTAPGTIAGDHDPAVFQFKNYTYPEIIADFRTFRRQMMALKPTGMRFVITVSPVPLTATASGQHVEVATAHSKATLRAVCGELAATCPNVDYFPSYEIITSVNNRGIYFEPNKRSVNKEGVTAAMSMFLRAHGFADAARPAVGARPDDDADHDASNDVICEEALLEAMRK